MQMLPALWIIGLSALFHTSDGKYVPNRQANAQFEKKHNACDQCSSIEDFGSFRHLPQERHYASHIYILFNICHIHHRYIYYSYIAGTLSSILVLSVIDYMCRQCYVWQIKIFEIWNDVWSKSLLKQLF